MCERPKVIPHPHGVEYGKLVVACRCCWQCRQQRVEDLTGRCLAEASMSDWVCVVALTYRDSPEREFDQAHKRTTVSHFQQWVRSLRDSHHSIRYLGVSEFGKLNSRAHFHAILFGKGQKPDWPNNRKYRWHMLQWPHGFVSTEFTFDVTALRYVVKYIQKGDIECWSTWSKKPPLGNDWFLQKAARDFQAGVLPWDWKYKPPGAQPGRRYLMTGATRRDYLIEYARLGGVDVTALPDNSAPWVNQVCQKVEKSLVDRMLDQDRKAYPGRYLAALAAEIEVKRPKYTRIEPIPDQDNPGMCFDPVTGRWRERTVAEYAAIRSAQVWEEWRRRQVASGRSTLDELRDEFALDPTLSAALSVEHNR